MKRLLPLTLALSTGCASVGLGPRPSVRADFDPRLDFPVTRIATASTDTPEPEAAPDEDRERKIDQISPAMFWTGMIIGIVGTGAALGFGIDGVVSENKIQTGYDEGISRQDRDDLQRRGERDNILAATGTGVAVLGFSWALIMAGVDYSRCGPLTKKRKCEKKGDP